MANARARVAADAAATAVIFLDPSGRRWRRFRLVASLLVVMLFGGLVYVFPHLHDTPALTTLGERLGPDLTSKQTGAHVPLVGDGPLVCVLAVRREHGRITGYDPFTQKRQRSFTGAEATHIGKSRYVIDRFGYSAAAHKTISLTFDDGPDPKWTPELLNVLAANKVPATFFATGTMIARQPGIFAREVREGHAVANHSLTHVDMTSVSGWRARLELTATDHVIRAVTGREVGYFRLPYEGNDEASTQDTIDGILRAQRYGYLVTSHDFDTDDWAYAAHQVKGSIPFPVLRGQNVTVLMHDGGGKGRQLTVDYVRKLIPYAKARGYTFHTMPQVQPWLQARTVPVKPTIWDKATLRLVQMRYVWPNVLIRILFLFAVASVLVVGLMNCVLAGLRQRRRRRQVWPSAEEMGLPVSVMLAAYNEESVIGRTLESILASEYPLAEVVVVDDGSTDATAEVVARMADGDARVRLIRQPNTGKAHALNRGLQSASGDYIVTLDADTILTPQTVSFLIRHFAVDSTGRLGAVAGVVRVGNRERNLLTRWQALEYLTQIGVERAAQDAMGAISIVPGACAAWRKKAILDVGGYTNVTLAEDCDLSLSLHRTGWRVTQDDEALAYTEAPETVDALLAQRTRWTYGTLQAIAKHRDMMLRRRYGWLGLFVLPNYVLSIVVPIIFLPFIVFVGVTAAQQQGVHVVLLYFLAFLAAHLLVAAVGVSLMRERYHHLLLVPVYRVVYEPLRAYLLYTSAYLAFRGVRMGWNKLTRTGAMDSSLAGMSPQLVEAQAKESGRR